MQDSEGGMEPIAVSFPLRGEWVAAHTPGQKVPSHGTHLLAQTYAYDFLRIDWDFPKSYRFFRKPLWRALAFGIPLRDCLGWAEPIRAPFDGEVVEAVDGVRERDPVHILREVPSSFVRGLFVRWGPDNAGLSRLLGNFIILKGDACYAFFAHARAGSVRVKSGQRVARGDALAEVGHSGNSTAPHLHFQLMDGPVLIEAKGLPCCFDEYEVFEDGAWRTVRNAIPGPTDRIRVL